MFACCQDDRTPTLPLLCRDCLQLQQADAPSGHLISAGRSQERGDKSRNVYQRRGEEPGRGGGGVLPVQQHAGLQVGNREQQLFLLPPRSLCIYGGQSRGSTVKNVY